MFVKLGDKSWLNCAHAKSVWIEEAEVGHGRYLCVVWFGDPAGDEAYTAPRYSFERYGLAERAQAMLDSLSKTR